MDGWMLLGRVKVATPFFWWLAGRIYIERESQKVIIKN
jgi:hypothetical protein